MTRLKTLAYPAYLTVFLVLGWAFFPQTTFALPAGFEFESVAGGFNYATTFTFTPDGRALVAEKSGVVKVVKNGAVLPTPLITLSDVNNYADRGLLGIAVDPQFATNGYVYLLYTHENTPGLNYSGPKTGRLVRVTVVGDVASEASKVVIIGTVGGGVGTPSCDNFAMGTDCIPSDSPSHSVGGLHFGPDGKLYVTLGDGAHFDYIDSRALRAQNLDSLSGKMLRINKDGTAPTDNPFYNGNPNANRSKVYALGLRNGFRFNFRGTSTTPFIGDVGWETWEEINLGVAGRNFGWPCREGNNPTTYGCTPSSTYTNPLYTYQHDGNGAGAIVAGSFPATGVYPAGYENSIFVADYAQNWLKRVVVDANNNFVSVQNFDTSPNGPVDIETGPDGAVYYLAIYTGDLVRINYTTGNRRPIAVLNASPASGLAPLAVQFSATGSSDPDGNPLTYLWNFGNGVTSTSSAPLYTYTANGTYEASLTVSDGLGGVAIKSKTITVGNRAPSVNITAPATGSLYTPGETIHLTAVATDPETGTLSGAQLNWQIILHHNIHTHLLETLTGNNPQFIAPDHQATDVYVEVKLTATDPAGLQTITSINLYLNNAVGAGNLILNPSMETADTLSSRPIYWAPSQYGENVATFTYPATPAALGGKAAKIQVTNYTDGDTKWAMDPVTVVPGKTYHFHSQYKSNKTTYLVAQFTDGAGNPSYLDLQTLPSSGGVFMPIERDIIMPAGTDTFAIFHVLRAVGELTIDDYSLVQGGGIPPINPPGTTNLIYNPSVETTSTTTATLPAGWLTGKWGTNTTTFTYPATPAYAGGKAVKINMTARTSGDAKWYFADVPVTAGTTYTFTNHYLATAPTTLTARYKAANGTFTYQDLGVVLPTSATFATSTRQITPPAGTVALTVFHLIKNVGSVTIDDFSLTPPVTADTTAPVVTVTSPANNATVSGVVNLAATATDAGGIAGVDFKIGSLTIPGTASSSAYIATWDSSTTQDGNEFILAVARDLAGNTATSSPIMVTVDNITSNPGGENLVLNPGLETGTTLPTNWHQGGWGNNTRTFTYPSAAHAGAKGAKVVITNYVDGDAKWYFDEVAVNPNHLYVVGDYYRSTAPSTVTARYTFADNSTAYVNVAELGATANWTAFNANLTMPANIASITLFHHLNANGTLEIDDAKVEPIDNTGNSDLFSQGFVSLTFDDGWRSQYDVARPILEARNLKGGFYLISNETLAGDSVNLTGNPSLEAEAVAGTPDNWSKGGWGNNTRTFTYPVAGFTGAKAAKLEVTNYVDGDAKWYFADVPVTPNEKYVISDAYRSNVGSTVTARYTFADNSVQYVDVATLPVAANWTNFNATITLPANISSLTLFHLLAANGSLEIDDVKVTRVTPYFGPAEALSLQGNGHEVGAHTKTHASLSTIATSTALEEINGSRSALLGLGLSPVDVMVYPYGDYNDAVEGWVDDAGYIGARSVDRGFNTKSTDKYALKIQQIDETVTIDQVRAWIDTARTDKTWLVLMFHQVGEPGNFYNASAAFLTEIADYLVTTNTPVRTLHQGLNLMNP